MIIHQTSIALRNFKFAGFFKSSRINNQILYLILLFMDGVASINDENKCQIHHNFTLE